MCNSILELVRVNSITGHTPVNLDRCKVDLPKNMVEAINSYNKRLLGDDELSSLLENIKTNLINNNSIISWETISLGMSNNEAFHLFAKMQSRLSDKDYWKGLRQCWSLSDNMPPRKLGVSLFSSQREGSEYFMSKEDKIRFDELPKKVLIYRGCSEEEASKNEFGLSWTVDKRVAVFFANDYLKNADKKTVVIEKTVSKNSIFAYISGREESEVIYFE